jgi:hypothetical protein
MKEDKKMTNENSNERRVLELIATDRIGMPIKSMAGKLDRAKPKLAKAIDLCEIGRYAGTRVYAEVRNDDTMKARGMADGIAAFADAYPRYGKILHGLIEEQRAVREVNMYFGVNDGCKLTSDDYMGVLTNMGFTEATAQRLYPELMDISRNLARKRKEERSVLIG